MAHLNHQNVAIIFFLGSFRDKNWLPNEPPAADGPLADRLVQSVQFHHRIEWKMWQRSARTRGSGRINIVVPFACIVWIDRWKIRGFFQVIHGIHRTIFTSKLMDTCIDIQVSKWNVSSQITNLIRPNYSS